MADDSSDVTFRLDLDTSLFHRKMAEISNAYKSLATTANKVPVVNQGAIETFADPSRLNSRAGISKGQTPQAYGQLTASLAAQTRVLESLQTGQKRFNTTGGRGKQIIDQWRDEGLGSLKGMFGSQFTKQMETDFLSSFNTSVNDLFSGLNSRTVNPANIAARFDELTKEYFHGMNIGATRIASPDAAGRTGAQYLAAQDKIAKDAASADAVAAKDAERDIQRAAKAREDSIKETKRTYKILADGINRYNASVQAAEAQAQAEINRATAANQKAAQDRGKARAAAGQKSQFEEELLRSQQANNVYDSYYANTYNPEGRERRLAQEAFERDRAADLAEQKRMQDESRREQQRANQRADRERKLNDARAYESDLAGRRNTGGATKRVRGTENKAIIENTIVLEEALAQRLATAETLMDLAKRQMKISKLEMTLASDSNQTLAVQEEKVRIQRELGRLKAKLENKDLLVSKAELQNQVGGASDLPVDRRAENRVDARAASASELAFIVGNEELSAKEINARREAKNSERELALAQGEARLNDSKEKVIGLRERTLQLSNQELTNSIQAAFLSDPGTAQRQADADVQKTINNKTRQNNATESGLNNIELAIAQEESELLAMKQKLAALDTAVENKEAAELQKQIAFRESQLAEVRRLAPDAKASSLAGKAEYDTSVFRAINASDSIRQKYVNAQAESILLKEDLKLAAQEQLIISEEHRNNLVRAAKIKTQQALLQQEASALASGQVLNDPQLLQRTLNASTESQLNNRKLAALQRLDLLSSSEFAAVSQKEVEANLRSKIVKKEAELNSASYKANLLKLRTLEVQEAQINAEITRQANLAAAGGGKGGRGGRLRSIFGGGGHGRNFDQLTGNPGEFFLGGLTSTLKYGVGAGLLYGSMGAISGAVKDSEALNISLGKLEVQLNSVDSSGDTFKRMRGDIIDLSKETGVLANDITNMATRMQGAFGNLEFNEKDPTGAMGGLRGNDGVIRYGQDAVDRSLEYASKLKAITDLTEQQLTDELVAASLAFGESADSIGDVAIKLEQTTSVSAGELLTFIGDIGPIAQNAGFELEELSAIGATIMKRTSVGGSAVAEQFGRIIASMREDSGKYFDLIELNRELLQESGDYQPLMTAVQNRDVSQTFKLLAKNFQNFSKSSQETLTSMLGDPRQFNTLLAVMGDPKSFAEAEKAAGDAFGATEQKMEKFREKLSFILSQLETSFNDIIKTIMDAGLVDAISDVASTLKVVLDVTGAIVGMFNSLDEVTGGFLTKIISFGLQMATIAGVAKMLRRMGGPAGGATDIVGMTTAQIAAQSASGGRFARWQNPNRLSGMEAFSLQRQSAISGGARRGVGALTGAAAGVRQAAGNFLGSVGPVGAGFLVVSAAVAGYGMIKNKIEKDRQKVREMISAALDSNASAEQLEKDAKVAADDMSGWDKFTSWLLGSETEVDAKNAAAAVKKSQELNEQLEVIAGSQLEFVNEILRGYDETTSNMKDEYETIYSKIVSASGLSGERIVSGLRANGMQISGDSADKILKGEIGLPDLLGDMTNQEWKDSDSDKVYEDLYKSLGIKSIFNAFRSDNVRGALTDIINNSDSTAEETEAAANIINQLDERERDLIMTKYNETTELINKFLAEDTSATIVALDEMLKRREEGSLSVSDLLTVVRKKIADYQSMPDRNEEESALLNELLGIQNTVMSEFLKQESDNLAEINDLIYGADDESDQRAIDSNLALLRNKEFTNTDVRKDAAMDLLEAQRATVDRMVEEAETTEEIQKLLDEGMAIPIEAATAIAEAQVRSSDLYQTTAAQFEKLRNAKLPRSEALEGIIKRSGIDRDLKPEDLLRQTYKEIEETGGVGKASIDKYIVMWQTLRQGMTNTEITEQERKDLLGAMKFIENLIGEVGNIAAQSSEIVKKTPFTLPKVSPIKSAAGVVAKAFGKNQKKNPFGIDIHKTMQASRKAAEEAMDKLREDEEEKAEDLASARLEIAKARAEDAGDLIEVARIGVRQAEAALAFARSNGTEGDVLKAQAEIINAKKALREAIADQRDTEAAYMKLVVAKDDPLLQAQMDLDLARTQEGEARGVKAKLEAAMSRVQAERAVAAQIADLRMAQMELRRAQLEAIDDEVGSAYLSAQMAQQELADAISRGAGGAEIARLQAGVVSADKSVRDTLFQNKLDEYDYLLNTGKLTKAQYVQYLEGLKATLEPGTKQFKDLEVQLYQLKQSLGADLQHNLPANLLLPTLYEGRRLAQGTSGGTAATGQAVGYQDNRNMNVQVVIGQNMTEAQIMTIMSDALGVNRNALTTAKRY